MSSYNYFANVYDDLTDNVEYEARARYIADLLAEHGITKGNLLDLACGTGTMSVLFQNRGFDVTGIDLSEDMLAVADNKSNGKLTLIKANMCNFRLMQPVNACVCCLDSVNHLTDIEDIKNCFKSVHNALCENGVFVFDVNTIYKHSRVLKDNSFIFDEDDYFLAWDNEWLEDNIVQIYIDIFVNNGKSYDRYSESFLEKAYSIDELKSALAPYFDVLNIYDELSHDKPKNDSQRLYFVCKRK